MMKFLKGKRRKITFKNLKKNRHHSRIRHTVRGNEFVVNVLEGAIFGKKAVGRPGLQYLKQVARNTAADSYTAMERVACNSCRWKAANQSEDRRIRRRWNHPVPGSMFPKFRRKVVPSSFCLDIVVNCYWVDTRWQ